MATEIINNGASLKIKVDGDPRDIIKSQIREVTVVRDTIIKIDIGLGALYNVFVDQATVTVPVSADVNDLKDQILGMLQTATQSGLATEQKQIDELAKITTLQGQVQDLQTKLASVDNKLFFRPCITDENNPNMVYKGYALPGSLVTDAVWAIEKISYTKGVLKSQWAAGNKNLDKIWNNRATLIYS